MKKVESIGHGLEAKWILVAAEERGAVVTEKGKRRALRRTHNENVSPIHWLGKQEGLNFVGSCNQRGFKPEVLSVSGLDSERVWRHQGI